MGEDSGFRQQVEGRRASTETRFVVSYEPKVEVKSELEAGAGAVTETDPNVRAKSWLENTLV